MIESRDIGGIVGAPALDPDGQKVGTVTQVLVDAESGQPQWATINPGLFSGSDAFVPLQRAEWDREHLLLPYTKEQLKDSPRFKIDQALAPAEQELLRRHYEPDAAGLDTARPDAAGPVDAPSDDTPGRHAGPVI
jgi:hypothetical protein